MLKREEEQHEGGQNKESYEEEEYEEEEEEEEEDEEGVTEEEKVKKRLIQRIHYSPRYNDDYYEYRHVILPREYYQKHIDKCFKNRKFSTAL